jgi:hypothetical protein
MIRKLLDDGLLVIKEDTTYTITLSEPRTEHKLLDAIVRTETANIGDNVRRWLQEFVL